MQHHEECWAMYLNRAGKLLGVSCISRSGIDCTVVDIRIVLQTCLLYTSYAAAPQENNAAYLKHCLTKLKEEPAFLVEILGDVNKAAKMIADKVTEPMNEPAAA